jgi:hypothetical protein
MIDNERLSIAENGTGSDIRAMMKARSGNSKRTESIVAPRQDYEAIHKVGPGYKRSVFFDRTPRKAR